MNDKGSFFEWVQSKDIDLQPWQWELVKILSEDKNVQISHTISRKGETILHRLWNEYHDGNPPGRTDSGKRNNGKN